MPAVVFQTANMGRIRSRADDGGLISYGPDTVNQWRRAASYVDRILKGEKPAESSGPSADEVRADR
jgi:ABC-type uncharacterized transport system substrate-binding protein